MKKFNLMAVLGICAAVTVVSLTGCGKSADEAQGPAAVCYAIAPTANAQGLNLNSPLVQDMAYDTVLNYGYVSSVVIDGEPEVLFANSYDIPEQYKSASKEKLKTDARAKTTGLLTAMQNAVANDPEVDYLAGLRLAVRSMASLEGYTSRTIVMVGTGFSTTGTMNFQNNLLSADAGTVVDLLEEKQEIPDLTGITVVWQQMGDVAAPQQPLSQSQNKKLQEIWGEVVERGNGEFVYNEIMAAPANTEAQYPVVSVVDLPAEAPVRFEVETLETESAFAVPVILYEEQVAFVGDRAEYLYPDEAVAVLQPIAEYLLQYDGVDILLAGTTAGDVDSAKTLQLSQARAQTVCNTLVQMGVDAQRIHTVGLGSSDPWHVPGGGYSGSIAAGNRKVVILDASSPLAQELLES